MEAGSSPVIQQSARGSSRRCLPALTEFGLNLGERLARLPTSIDKLSSARPLPAVSHRQQGESATTGLHYTRSGTEADDLAGLMVDAPLAVLTFAAMFRGAEGFRREAGREDGR